MKAIHDFVIEIKEPYKETITTDSGFEVFLDKRFNAKELASKTGIVRAVPFFKDTDIKVGFEVVIDTTVLMEHSYRNIKQESTFIVDKKDNLYYIHYDMILLYREDETKPWNCHSKNVFVEPITEKKEEETSLILSLEELKPSYKKGRAKVKFLNEYLEENDVNIGDTLIIKEERDIEYKLGGNTYWWIRNRDILGVEV